MQIGLLIGLVVAQAASTPALKIAAPGLNGVSIGETKATFYGEHLAQELALAGATVTTPREIQTLLGLERQKHLLGCTDQPNCLAEVGNALGVDAILLGDIAKIGERFQLNAKLISASNGSTIAVQSIRVGDEEELLDACAEVAKVMADEGAARLGRTLTPRKRAQLGPKEPGVVVSRPGARQWWWAPAAVAVLSGGAAGFSAFQAQQRYQALTTGTGLTSAQAEQLRGEGVTWRTVTQVTTGVAAAAAVGAIALLVFAPSEAPVAALTVDGQGATLVVGGTF